MRGDRTQSQNEIHQQKRKKIVYDKVSQNYKPSSLEDLDFAGPI